MKILYGQYAPDSGEVIISGKTYPVDVLERKRAGIGMVHQNFMQIPELSVLENIIASQAKTRFGFLDTKKDEERIKEYFALLGLNLELSEIVGNLSVGERQKLEIIKALFGGASILILDEPTAVLTPQETDELFSIIRQLAAEGKTIIFISHKLREVLAISDRITVMRRGKIVANSLPNIQLKESDLAEHMVGRTNFSLLQSWKEYGMTGDISVLDVESLFYVSKAGKTCLNGLSLSVKKGEILGIGGVEGNGQSELARLLIGLLKPTSGHLFLENVDVSQLSVYQRRQLGIAFISEDRMHEGLSLTASVQENLICGHERKEPISKNHFLNFKYIRKFSEDLIKKYDVRGTPALSAPIQSMSGGNLQKLVLARELAHQPKILIASQPTRGLDIGAINFVRNTLLEASKQGLAIILITADLEELMALSDRILVIYEGRSMGILKRQDGYNENEIGLMMGGIEYEE
ncbi:MAG TPA: ABC transporter ATP-binding protein [Clostridiaceae bacterium]|nr:ABC transporter ATP-binding protein [Clostridiaceae bacterium]